MEREGFDIPLLIGGATTSRVHTAVKIHPRYSRCSDGACQRREPRGRRRRVAAVAGDPRRDDPVGARRVSQGGGGARAQRSRQGPRAAREGARQCAEGRLERLSPHDADLFRAARVSNGAISPTSRAISTGRRSSRPGSSRAAIPPSSTTRIRARRRALCSTTRKRCSSASSTSNGSRRKRWSASGRRRRSATTSSCSPTIRAPTPIATLFTLRQQLSRRDGRPNVALADFVAPASSGAHDYVGAFVVTAGLADDAIAKRFEHANDDYSSIMVKALADRFAEALRRSDARARAPRALGLCA